MEFAAAGLLAFFREANPTFGGAIKEASAATFAR